jgi:glycosyltransferase involved in cell wall biosynthesis
MARGALERLVTSMPWSRMDDMRGLEEKVLSLSWLGYTNFLLHRAPVVRSLFRSNYHQSVIFDRCVARALGDCNVLFGLSGTMLYSARAARARNAMTLLYSGSIHIADQLAIIDREYGSLSLAQGFIDGRVIAKTIAELQEVDGLVVPSRLVKRSFVSNGVDPLKIRVIPEPLSRALPVGRRIVPSQFTILAVGSIGVRKGTHYLLEAVKNMSEPKPAVILIGGVEPGYAKVLRRFDGLFRLMGRVSDEQLARAYCEASVFVLPSVEDGWGHVTVEAMAAGLPVIVSDQAGSADMVTDGETGFVVPSRNSSVLQQRLEILRDSPEKVATMGEAARRDVSRLTPEAQACSILSAIDDLRSRQVSVCARRV